MHVTLDKANCQIHTPTALTLGKKVPSRLSVQCRVGPRAALGIREKKISLDPSEIDCPARIIVATSTVPVARTVTRGKHYLSEETETKFCIWHCTFQFAKFAY